RWTATCWSKSSRTTRWASRWSRPQSASSAKLKADPTKETCMQKGEAEASPFLSFLADPLQNQSAPRRRRGGDAHRIPIALARLRHLVGAVGVEESKRLSPLDWLPDL